MPGIPHDPKADINLIRSILHAGYEDGFPVLKELLQNADDAGGGDAAASASTVVILLAPSGLPGSTHPLLYQRPALCVLNDGDFRQTDAKCLPMLGLSNKAAERTSVGKFGIGLKTVFYLTDAFVFFCHEQRDWSEEEKVCNLVNPWAKKHRPSWEDDWTATNAHEQQRLQHLAKDGLGLHRFLGIWIPLRHRSDAKPEVIRSYYPDKSLDAIFGERWAQRLVEFAPLLRHVRTISARKLMPDGSCEQLLHISPRPKSACQFVRLENGALHGELELCNGQDVPQFVHFHGVETMGTAELTQRFQGSAHWPRQAAFDETTDQPERATPHGAVVFTRRPAPNGGGRVQVQHAVFLPLGDAEQLPLSGKWDYSVFLHGFYFVGSSRRHIEPFDPQSDHREDDALTNLSEAELRRAWNCRLTAELICPDFVPALAGFVDRIQATSDEVSGLVRAVAESKVLKSYKQWLYARHQFFFRLDQNGGAWKAESAEMSVYVIPAPKFPFQRLLAALPSLQRIATEQVVTLKGKPLLSSKPPTRLPDDLLAELFAGVPVTVFDHNDECNYLLDLIPEDTATCTPDSALTRTLVPLANGFIVRRLPEDSELRELWIAFFKRLPLQAFIRLPCESSEALPQLASALAGVELPVALLWQDFCQAEGEATLACGQLLSLLRQLGGLNLADETAVMQRSGIVVRLFKAFDGKPSDWHSAVVALPLFHVREAGGKTVSASISDLNTAHSEERLFTGGESWAKDLVKAAPELKLVFVDVTVSELVGISASACDGAECVKLLCRATRLAADFASRKPLFERILAAAEHAGGGAWAALRCLLHGNLSAWEQTNRIFRDSGEHAMFVRLVKQALVMAGQPWRLITSHVTSQLGLTADQEQQLNLSATAAKNVEALLKEIAPEKMDCADLSRDYCDLLLRQFDDVDVLRALNIHDMLDGHRVRIDKHTYVVDGSFTALPPEFDQLVTRIRPNTGYARFTSPELVPNLGWEAVIRIAVEKPQPESYCDTILTAVGTLGTLHTKLKAVVFDSPWLKMADGTAVAPSVLLHVPGADTELDQLPLEVLARRVPLQRLGQSVRDHHRFETFKRTVLPPVKEALEAVAGLLQSHTAYSTGLSGEWSPDDTRDWVETLADAPADALPLVNLAHAFSGNEQVRDFLPKFLNGLGGKLQAAAYAAVLKHLAVGYENADDDTRAMWLRTMIRYLKAIGEGDVNFARGILASAGVKLVSAEGHTKSPRELTFANTSIHPDDQLDMAISLALEFLKPTQLVVQEELNEAPVEPAETTNEQIRELRAYFAPWRGAIKATDPIGALLCLLGSGPDLLRLRKEFFSTWSPDKVLDWIDANDAREAELGSIRDRINRRRFKVSIVAGSTVEVRAVLGDDFRARVAILPTNLLIGCDGDGSIWQEAGQTICHFGFRKLPIEHEHLTDEVLVGLLRETAAAILRRALRAVVDIRPLFGKLSEATQLHVCVAQNMIVEQALAFLRQVRAQEHPQIKIALTKWDDARRQAAVETFHQLNSCRSSELRGEALEAIRNLLSGDADVQATVLRGVKSKLSDVEYSLESIPFELWQNADDAVAQLVSLGIDSCHAADLGFLSSKSGSDLLFVHWGRPINEFAGPDGRNCRDDGFDRDLENMLVPEISDKADASLHGGAALTGKFGLGFKSVFLASDAPEILSASVDFVIRGGIYPVRLEDSQRDQLLSALQAAAPNDVRRGTVIRLPLRADGGINADEVLGLFRKLAPFLVIFSRRLKRLRFSEEGGEQRELRWQPKPFLCGQCEFGKLPESLGDVTGALTLLSALEPGGNRLIFLLGLNQDGFAPLPSHVPVFWVTAPTRDTPDYGFAVNGPFEPNVGRVRLVKSERNERLAKALSEVVSTRLAALWNWAEADWEAFRRELHLSSSASCNSVWESLWKLLGVHFSEKGRKDDTSFEAELARGILWKSEATGMRHFYAACAALPTGLWGEHTALTRLGEVHFVASGALDRESVFGIVSGWKEFKQRLAVGSICSGSQVASVLERLGAPLSEAEKVHLATVIDWGLGKEKRADPEQAAQLGELITPNFMTGLENGQMGEREETEHKRLVELLRDVSFQAADGSWHKPTGLVVDERDEVETDEKLRAAFAPQEHRLNPAYTGPGLAFFLACRPRLEAGVEAMAEWILLATSEPTRVAALQYLLKGELREHVTEELRRQRDDNKWLWQLKTGLFDWFKDKFSDEAERYEILAYRLRLFEEQLRQAAETEEQEEQQDEQEPEMAQPWTVRELWKWWHEQGEPTGDYTLEGEANWALFHGGALWGQEERKAELKRLLLSPDDPAGKALWYRLFGYACLVSAGRTMTELREFWKYQLNPRQFWERTSEGDFSERTQEIFEQAVTAKFTDMAAGGEQAYFWRRLFYDIRKVHRMVQNEFPAVLLDLVNQGHGAHLRQFLRTGHLPGPDQPRWIGTFGQSADTPLGFIIRELVRLEIIRDKAMLPYAFYVCRPVLRALWKIRWIENPEGSFTGEDWINKLKDDREFEPKLLSFFDIPLLHMGITYRGDKMPVPPQ